MLAILSQVFYFHNYVLAQDPATGSVVVGLQPLWSLSVEEHFYLVFPLMFLLFLRGRVGIGHFLGLLVAIVAWRYVRWEFLLDTEWAIYVSTDTRFDSILFGCLLALLERDGVAGRLLPGDDRRLTLILFAALLVLTASILARDVTFRSTLRYSVQGAALMVVFHYAVTRPDYWAFRPLNLGWVRTIGLYSYSIYLAHYVIIRILHKHGWYEASTGLAIAAAAVFSIGYAAFLWHVVEAVPRRLRHRFA